MPVFRSQPSLTQLYPAVGAVLVGVLAVWAFTLSAAREEPTPEKRNTLVATEADSPEVFLAIRPWLASGAEPSPENFQWLAQKGYRWVLSVDSIAPDLDAAAQAGLRYLHLPISYQDVPLQAIATLQALLEEIGDEPLFVHCHHGKHRGPTMAALLLLLREPEQSEEAVQILEQAGTSLDDPGLWKSVREFLPRAHAEVEPLALEESASANDMAQTMGEIDRRFDELKALVDAGPAGLSEEDSSPALMIAEAYRESFRVTKQSQEYDDAFLQLLIEGDALAMQVHADLQSNSPSAAKASLLALKSSCRSCHQRYRD